MDSFVYTPNSGRVVFGSGTLQKLPEEIERLNLSAPLLLSTPQQVSQAENLKNVLNGKIAGIFTEATMHTPTDVTEKALQYAKDTRADSVVSVGGGSTIGLGKAISIRTGLPHICIPTTYAGSEMTPILGETADGVKKTRSDPKILPGTVIYDVDLTMTLPAAMSATSGVNAIAHAGKFDRSAVSQLISMGQYVSDHGRQWKHYMHVIQILLLISLHWKGPRHWQVLFQKLWRTPLHLQHALRRYMELGCAVHALEAWECLFTTNCATPSAVVSISPMQKRTRLSFLTPSRIMRPEYQRR